jgi:hypothetical protein
VLAGLGRGDGALWVGGGETTTVGIVQREEGQRGGVRVASSFSFHVAQPGSGQRGLGLDQGDSTGMATGSERTGTVLVTVKSIFPDFCPPGARHNARKNSNFEFLKTPLWFVKIPHKDPRYIFVEQRDEVLQKSYLNFGVWSLFQIQTLVDV